MLIKWVLLKMNEDTVIAGNEITRKIEPKNADNTGVVAKDKKDKDAEKSMRFSFRITRIKDTDSHKETLKIECLDNGTPNGEIETNLLNLEKDIYKFKEYGVALSRSAFIDLVQMIENEYFNLHQDDKKSENKSKDFVDDDIKDFVMMVKEYCLLGNYLSENEKKEKLYNIPVAEFNALIMDSYYSVYDLTKIKEKLKEKIVIRCVKNRNDNLIRINDKPTRVITFDKAKIDEYMAKKNENNSGQNKETNE